jgi:hypothetical protein
VKGLPSLLRALLDVNPGVCDEPSLDERQGTLFPGYLTSKALALRLQSFVEESNITYIGPPDLFAASVHKTLGTFLGKACEIPALIGAPAHIFAQQHARLRPSVGCCCAGPRVVSLDYRDEDVTRGCGKKHGDHLRLWRILMPGMVVRRTPKRRPRPAQELSTDDVHEFQSGLGIEASLAPLPSNDRQQRARGASDACVHGCRIIF